ncbi:MAG: glycosyltransferase [Candidatus Saccharibacteria bacterium]
MNLVLIAFCLGLILDVATHLGTFMWRIRHFLVFFNVLLTAFACGAIVMWHPNTASFLIGLAGIYRIFNAVRIVKGRMHEAYLRNATRTTSFVLIMFQGLVAVVWWLWHMHNGNRRLLWVGISAAQLLVACVLVASTTRRLRRTMPTASTKHFSDVQLPSISIAIPARNETEDLQACLASIIASDYPKFEILVLDDCSQDKHTPEIIRSFAHDGVRFLQGDEPRETWLAKNQAYDQLAREASGELILFCGVDVRFEPDAIRKLVIVMLERNKQMISVLPRRADRVTGRFALVQAMRYWWELVPPRRLFNRPAVLSSCWIVNADALKRTGGFAAVTRAIVPEAYFARQLITHDAYSFIQSDNMLGIESIKSPEDQRNTALRMRYPQLHRRPEMVYVLSLFELGFLVLPFVLAIGGWWLPVSHWTVWLAIAASVLLIISYEEMAISTRINYWMFALIALPFVAMTDFVLLHRSMWQYEFSEVDWKGRNVCVPVMHTYPHLPEATKR